MSEGTKHRNCPQQWFLFQHTWFAPALYVVYRDGGISPTASPSESCCFPVTYTFPTLITADNVFSSSQAHGSKYHVENNLHRAGRGVHGWETVRLLGFVCSGSSVSVPCVQSPLHTLNDHGHQGGCALAPLPCWSGTSSLHCKGTKIAIPYSCV